MYYANIKGKNSKYLISRSIKVKFKCGSVAKNTTPRDPSCRIEPATLDILSNALPTITISYVILLVGRSILDIIINIDASVSLENTITSVVFSIIL